MELENCLMSENEDASWFTAGTGRLASCRWLLLPQNAEFGSRHAFVGGTYLGRMNIFNPALQRLYTK